MHGIFLRLQKIPGFYWFLISDFWFLISESISTKRRPPTNDVNFRKNSFSH
jgi:hypothetical protein